MELIVPTLHGPVSCFYLHTRPGNYLLEYRRSLVFEGRLSLPLSSLPEQGYVIGTQYRVSRESSSAAPSSYCLG